MAEDDREVKQEMKDEHEVEEEDISKKITAKLKSKGARSNTLMRNSSALKKASAFSKVLSKCKSTKQPKRKFKLAKSPPPVDCKACQA
ncbi:hypothetical protein KP79_PYT08059 [Mizuhopecten yessoensis]|uniref:Uncharacterized protein n=1 Tax=Mizuhopecten yessoensis TaxID=6573 RepID=A0A210Q9H2_MIZYE|nr:hypothetical protein KP79_PYT08059 [Mizuhopecten yessoensis]